MPMLQIGLTLAGIFFGGIAAFVGLAVTVLALKSGEISVSMQSSSGATGHVANRVADPSRFWTDLTLYGAAPLVVGALFAWYSWRRLKTG